RHEGAPADGWARASPAVYVLGPVRLHDLGHRLDHVRYVLVGVRGAQGQRQHALELALRNRELARLEPVAVAVVRMRVDRDEVHARADVALAQLVDELVAADAQTALTQPEQV